MSYRTWICPKIHTYCILSIFFCTCCQFIQIFFNVSFSIKYTIFFLQKVVRDHFTTVLYPYPSLSPSSTNSLQTLVQTFMIKDARLSTDALPVLNKLMNAIQPNFLDRI